MFVIDWLSKQSALRPDKVALVDLASDRHITYRQLDERASRFAEVLSERWKVGPVNVSPCWRTTVPTTSKCSTDARRPARSRSA